MSGPCLLWKGCDQVLRGGLCVCTEVDRFKTSLKRGKAKSMGAVWQEIGHSLSSGPQWFWDGQSGQGWVSRPSFLSVRMLEMKPEGLEAGVPFPALEGDSGLRWQRLRVGLLLLADSYARTGTFVLPATYCSVPGRVPASGPAPMTDTT